MFPVAAVDVNAWHGAVTKPLVDLVLRVFGEIDHAGRDLYYRKIFKDQPAVCFLGRNEADPGLR